MQISCNGHGLELGPCKYVVCLDDIGDDIYKLAEQHHRSRIRIITKPGRWYASQSFPVTMPSFPFTGFAAVWWAWWRGFKPIHVTGMDCYQDDPSYWSSDDEKARCLARQAEWWRTTHEICEGIDLRGITYPTH